ncbi:ribosomal protein S6 kinase beta-1 [Striga asiatica]|uniref:Ribosomal protein S6 kinase beta-1 n=1 Tax=Striga asiatica TaxID=4170 RepID=A0A5A7Q7V4_STRAF|nr:ribosomal protein S6 kinase beta-1 [Striga asiatica]
MAGEDAGGVGGEDGRGCMGLGKRKEKENREGKKTGRRPGQAAGDDSRKKKVRCQTPVPTVGTQPMSLKCTSTSSRPPTFENPNLGPYAPTKFPSQLIFSFSATIDIPDLFYAFVQNFSKNDI